MKICIIGLGSIAKRHITNLKEILKVDVSITVLRSGRGMEIESNILPMIDHLYYDDAMLENHYDAVFITNPTGMHYNTLLRYKKLSDSFFIEKPIFVTGRENIEPFWNDGNTYYVACPLRYTNVIQYLKKNIDFSIVYSMRCISSSYLPEWRPGTDYRESYSAHKSMGGGVSVDLIHEWDYIHYLIGAPIEVKSIIQKKSELEIDSDDIAVYVAAYKDKVVEVHLDYFGREPVRKIELFGKNDTIVADLIHQRITYLKRGTVIDFAQERDDYQKRELWHFFDIINGKRASDNDLNEACRILRVARGGN